MKKVLAFIDGSIYSKSVCDYASWVAIRSDAALDILHVLGRRNVSTAPTDLSGSIGLGARTALLEELTELDEQKAQLTHKRGRAILEDAKERATYAGADYVRTMLRNDGIVETLVEFEKDADVVVIGKRGEAADFDTMHLGSHMERVVRSSRRPVLVVSRAFRPPSRFLVAFDGGPSSLKAINFIAETNVFKALECHLITAGEGTVKMRNQLEGAAALLREAGYTVDESIHEGEVERVLTQKISGDEIDLLVMGAYGHSRIRNLLIGSTTTEMVRSCQIPVLLFR